MNYITEINSFREFTSTNPLTANTQALWFLLLHINNSCGWSEWFHVSNSRLSEELCMSEKTMRNQRDILIEKGLILYESQRRKKNSGRYKMVSIKVRLTKLSSKTTVNSPVDSQTTFKTTVDSPVDSQTTFKTTVDSLVDLQTTVNTTVVSTKNQKTTFQIPDINKRSSNNINTTTTELDLKKVIEFYNLNFHEITNHEIDKIKAWSQQLDPEVLLLALEISVESGKRTMKYFEGILRNWIKHNLRTLESIKNNQERYRATSTQHDGKVINLKPKNSFHNFEQREKKYSNAELEKKLGIRK